MSTVSQPTEATRAAKGEEGEGGKEGMQGVGCSLLWETRGKSPKDVCVPAVETEMQGRADWGDCSEQRLSLRCERIAGAAMRFVHRMFRERKGERAEKQTNGHEKGWPKELQGGEEQL